MTAFLRPRPVAEPALRLIAFHHAGGSASVYYPLIRALPNDWDLLLYDMPGRGRRHAEAPLRRIEDIVQQVGRDLDGWLDLPFALFGHSLGAIVASAFARICNASSRPPFWLGVSGRQGPSATVRRRHLHKLGEAELLEALLALGGMPAKLVEEPDFLSLFLQIARSDLEAVDSYEPPPADRSASYPITALAGSTDPWAPPELMRSWADESVGPFSLVPFDGGHFHFLGAAFPAFAASIVSAVAASHGGSSWPVRATDRQRISSVG